MLNHEVIGPSPEGKHLVAYQTPGCAIPTVVCICETVGQAQAEAKRLNDEQINREKALRWEFELRGMEGVYPGLQEAAQ